MFTADTSSLLMSAINIIFYLLAAIFILTSAITIYSLIRYGKDRILVTGVTVTYLVVSTTLFTLAVSQLNRIKFF